MAIRIAAVGVSHWHALNDAAYLRALLAMPDVELVAIQAAVSAAGQTVGVERDQAAGRGVVHVMGGAVRAVALAEPVPERT